MCGIFGMNMPDATLPERLVVLSVLASNMDRRGDQSWGAVAWAEDKALVRKCVGSITGASVMPLAQWGNVMGHTRLATTGAVSARNAHPFAIAGVLGVHNGMVDNHRALGATWASDHECDSEIIFHGIARQETHAVSAYGAVAFLRYAGRPDFEGKTGARSIQRHVRLVDNRPHLARFNDGQLSAARVYRGDVALGIVYASTWAAVAEACAMSGLRAEEYKIAQGRLYRIESGELWDAGKFKIGRRQSLADWRSGGKYASSYVHGYGGRTNADDELLAKWIADSKSAEDSTALAHRPAGGHVRMCDDCTVTSAKYYVRRLAGAYLCGGCAADYNLSVEDCQLLP